MVQEGGAEGGDTAGEDDQDVETRGEGVGADLLSDQQLLQVGQDVLPRYLGQLLSVVLVAVGQPGQGCSELRWRKSPDT